MWASSTGVKPAAAGFATGRRSATFTSKTVPLPEALKAMLPAAQVKPSVLSALMSLLWMPVPDTILLPVKIIWKALAVRTTAGAVSYTHLTLPTIYSV